LFPGVPAGDILEVAGNPADLHDIMGAALRADGFAAERAVLNPGDHFMGTVAVVEWAHDLKVGLTAVGAGHCIDNKVAGVSFVLVLFFGNIFEAFIFFC
jgi:hypothetical protein